MPHTAGRSARFLKNLGYSCGHDLAVFFHDVPGMLLRKEGPVIFADDLLCALVNGLRGSGIDEYVPAVTVFHVDEIRGALKQRFQHKPMLNERLLGSLRNIPGRHPGIPRVTRLLQRHGD